MALNHLPDRLIALPFRKGEKDTPDWTVCWKYVQTNHSSNATSAVDEALKSMNTFHNSIVKTCTDDTKHPPNLNFVELTLKKYCKYVAMAQSHLPLQEKLSGKLKFFWRDSFDDSIKYEGKDSNIELVSCVYNLAATYTFIGSTSARTGAVEEVKDAFNHFQNAAGYYNMVESLLDRLPPDQLLKGDIKRDSLDLLRRISLAQAHHCGYLKAETAIKDNHDMLSKIAMQGAKMYEEIIPIFRKSQWRTATSLPWRNSNAKEAEAQLVANKVVMEARAHIHLALKNEAETEMGVAIAYYIKAKEILRELPKMQTTEQTTWVNSIVKSVNAAHEAADKANSSVYYARVPKEIAKPSTLPRPLGQPSEPDSFVNFKSVRGDDPFFGIVPAHIASIGAQWRDKMRKKANTCGEFAKSQRRGTQDNIQKLGVSATVQTLSDENQQRGKVPEPLRSRILALRDGETGRSNKTTDNLVNHVKSCEELHSVCKSKLKEVLDELAKDKEAEKRYIEAYGEKMWRSVFPPAEQTPDYNSLLAAVNEHKNGLQQWLMNPLTSAKATMNENLQSIARLDFSMAELDNLMPYSKSKESRQQSDKVKAIVKQLKGILESQRTIEEEQKKKLGLLQDTIESDEIIYGLAAVDTAQRDGIIGTNTKKVNDIIEEVNVESRKLQSLSKDAEEAMSKLGEVQSTDPQFKEIQKVTVDLEKACSLYEEFLKDFESIVTYGSKAVDDIDSTLSLAKSYILSRQFEAEEVQGRLDAIIAQKMSEMDSSTPQQHRLSDAPNLSQRPSATPSYNYQQPPPQQPSPNLSQRPSATPSYNYQQPPPQQQQQRPSYDYPPSAVQQSSYQYQQIPQQAPPAPIQYSAPPPQQDRPPSYDDVMGGQGQALPPGYQYPPQFPPSNNYQYPPPQ